MEHQAVAEAGVIGKPDPVALEVVKAFVALKNGFAPSEELLRELLGHGRKRLGAVVAPKEIEFVPSLPNNRAGKIMRRLLKAARWGSRKETPQHLKRAEEFAGRMRELWPVCPLRMWHRSAP